MKNVIKDSAFDQ